MPPALIMGVGCNCAICPRCKDVWPNVMLDRWTIDVLDQSNVQTNPVLDHGSNRVPVELAHQVCDL